MSSNASRTCCVRGGQFADRPVRAEHEPVRAEQFDRAGHERAQVVRPSSPAESASVTRPESFATTLGQAATGATRARHWSRPAAPAAIRGLPRWSRTNRESGSAAAARATAGNCSTRTTNSLTRPASATVREPGADLRPVEVVVGLALYLVPDADEQVPAGAGAVGGEGVGQCRIGERRPADHPGDLGRARRRAPGTRWSRRRRRGRPRPARSGRRRAARRLRRRSSTV